MITATKLQGEQARVLRWRLQQFLSSATKAFLTRIVHSADDETETCAETDVAKLEALLLRWQELNETQIELDVPDGDVQKEAP